MRFLSHSLSARLILFGRLIVIHSVEGSLSGFTIALIIYSVDPCFARRICLLF